MGEEIIMNKRKEDWVNKKRQKSWEKLCWTLAIMFQIFLLVNLTTANSYVIAQTNDVFVEAIIEERKDFGEEFLDFGVGLLSFFVIKEIGFVSANILDTPDDATTYVNPEHSINEDETNWNCCLKTDAGAICQDLAPAFVEDCDGSVIPTPCKNVGECKTGCCVDPVEGLCSTKATKAKCEGGGGEWYEGDSCLIDECQRGCCVLGSNVEFVNEARCGRISSVQGFAKDFRDVQTEIECLAIKETQEFGACVLQGGSCSFKTELECAEMGGSFYEDTLCSDESLGTNCRKQDSIGCFEGKDEIYWFDSCGNRENIYSSDKDFSWNNGKFLDKAESCDPSESNADSETCGNCNYLLGSRCSETGLTGKKVKDGNFVCGDMNCVDENGNERQNGESWCVYDASIGIPEGENFASDPAGSRHWKRMCIDGEIKVEPCADYRGQICVQSDVEGDRDEFSTAACVINEALTCVMEYNKNEDMKSCAENSHCIVKEVDVDEGFKFDMCVGQYPRGFDLNEGKEGEARGSAEQLCSLANQKCIVLYEKKISGWKCVFNCDCETKKFSEEMNDLCISLGDCGSYINYVGDGTDNIKVKGAPSISWNKYKKFAEVVEGKFAEPKNSSELLDAVFGEGGGGEMGVGGYEPGKNGMSMLGTIVGGTGTLLTAGAMAYHMGAGIAGFHSLASGSFWSTGFAMAKGTPVIGAFGTVAAGFSIGVMVGGLIAKAMGLQGQGAMLMAAGGGLVGAGVGILLLGLKNFWNPVGWILIIVGIIVMIVTAILGIGKTKKVIVKFKCYPWEPPVGAGNCEKCNEDPLKPCSEYRCSSLGQGCELINLDSEYPICKSTANDGRGPVISPGGIQVGYRFENERADGVDVREENGNCIPEFTSVLFSLETDEHAQCKFDMVRGKDYEEKEEFFLEQNAYVKNHTTAFMMPSLAALEAEYNISITGDVKEKLANPVMWVQCQDSHGNMNSREYAIDFCVKSGPDTTPAAITLYSPVSGAVLKHGVEEIGLKIYLNEPATCKYDVEDKAYADMASEFECQTGLEEAEERGGWPCSTQLTGLTKDENKFYIKCMDQPWLAGVEDEKRNVNTESVLYVLYSSKHALKIDSISPNGTITEGFEPISVDLEVETSGGVNGKAMCTYSFLEDGEGIAFYETFSNYHKQTFDTMMRGSYNIFVRCEDDAGNVAEGDTSFVLDIDTLSPIAVRVYEDGGSLRLITNTDAECYYSHKRCNFDFDDDEIESMTTAFSTEHFADWNTGLTYYIKCKDVWGNAPNGCTIKILPSS